MLPSRAEIVVHLKKIAPVRRDIVFHLGKNCPRLLRTSFFTPKKSSRPDGHRFPPRKNRSPARADIVFHLEKIAPVRTDIVFHLRKTDPTFYEHRFNPEKIPPPGRTSFFTSKKSLLPARTSFFTSEKLPCLLRTSFFTPKKSSLSAQTTFGRSLESAPTRSRSKQLFFGGNRESAPISGTAARTFWKPGQSPDQLRYKSERRLCRRPDQRQAELHNERNFDGARSTELWIGLNIFGNSLNGVLTEFIDLLIYCGNCPLQVSHEGTYKKTVHRVGTSSFIQSINIRILFRIL